MPASASKSALLLSPCLRWAWEGARQFEDEFANTSKRDKGTDFHKGMEIYVSDDTFYAWRTVSEDVRQWAHAAGSWFDKHMRPRCQEILTEVYVATNFSTRKVHTDVTVHDRKYPDMPGYLPGTADLVLLLVDGSLLVADWKTGSGGGADKQLLTLAFGLREVFRMPDGSYRKVRLAILYAGDQTGKDGVHPVEWEVSHQELEAHAVAMDFQYRDIGIRTEPAPGIHCTQLYCGHLAYCPGISRTVDAASVGPEGLLSAEALTRKTAASVSISTPPLDDHHAGAIMERVTAAKRQMDFYEKRVRSYVLNGGRCIAGDYEFSKKADGFRWRKM